MRQDNFKLTLETVNIMTIFIPDPMFTGGQRYQPKRKVLLSADLDLDALGFAFPTLGVTIGV